MKSKAMHARKVKPSAETLSAVADALFEERQAAGELLYNEQCKAEREARFWEELPARMEADFAELKAEKAAWQAGESARIAELDAWREKCRQERDNEVAARRAP